MKARIGNLKRGVYWQWFRVVWYESFEYEGRLLLGLSLFKKIHCRWVTFFTFAIICFGISSNRFLGHAPNLPRVMRQPPENVIEDNRCGSLQPGEG